MVITRLAGGLGNQMFQYAIARHYARQNEAIVLDAHLLKPLENDIDKIDQRPFALGIFKNLKAAGSRKVHSMLTGASILNRIRRKVFLANTQVLRQELMEDVGEIKRNKKNLYLVGNFQSEKYFADLREDLLRDFTFPEMDAVNDRLGRFIQATTDAVCVHIRRGDYLSKSNNNIFNCITPDYYQNALQRMKELLGKKHLNLFVFTDDYEWVKNNFNVPSCDIVIVSGNDNTDSWKDMRLMSLCQHHIIANSSFSWWGCWLSTRKGINIAPATWFRPGTYDYDIQLIIPQNWKLVSF